jgi:hypothetical protein
MDSAPKMFLIEDEIHAEPQGKFSTYDLALAEIKRRSTIPFEQSPNKCPCTNWENCERLYQIVEYNVLTIPWIELSRKDILKISPEGIQWV